MIITTTSYYGMKLSTNCSCTFWSLEVRIKNAEFCNEKWCHQNKIFLTSYVDMNNWDLTVKKAWD